jgi:hypothetical protein
VIGRRPFAINEPEPDRPAINRLYVRSLTQTVGGNAMGVGSAEFAHRAVLPEFDGSKALIDPITAFTVRSVRLPPILGTDLAGLHTALSTIGGEGTDPESLRVVRVTDTMGLNRFYASEAIVEESREREDLQVVDEPTEIPFQDGDSLLPSPE